MKKRKAEKYKGFDIIPIICDAWMISEATGDWMIFDTYSECTDFIDKQVKF